MIGGFSKGLDPPAQRSNVYLGFVLDEKRVILRMMKENIKSSLLVSFWKIKAAPIQVRTKNR